MESSKKLFALTFDDGPNTSTMVKVLDLLEKYNAVATFFLVGNYINGETAPVLKRALDMGCELANHSLTHSHMAQFTAEEAVDEITNTQKRIYEAAGVEAKWFRPPYISVSDTLYRSVQLPFIRGYSTFDFDKNVGVEERAFNLLSKAGRGKIAVMHCFVGNDQTVEALKIALPQLTEQGYTLVTVSELFDEYGYEPVANNAVMYNGIAEFESK